MTSTSKRNLPTDAEISQGMALLFDPNQAELCRQTKALIASQYKKTVVYTDYKTGGHEGKTGAKLG
jgi:hypothetical protein